MGSEDITEDIFYYHLLSIAAKLKIKLLVMEVGDYDQASRVIRIANKSTPSIWAFGEIWRDNIYTGDDNDAQVSSPESNSPLHYTSVGSGHGRVVVLWRQGFEMTPHCTSGTLSKNIKVTTGMI